MNLDINADGNIVLGAEVSLDRMRLRRYADTGYALVFVKSLINGVPSTVIFQPVDEGAIPATPCATPPLNDIRDVLDWMHTEVASASQAGIIEPRDRDRLLALAGRVEAWLVEQGE